MVEFDKNRVCRYQGVRVGGNEAEMSQNYDKIETKLRQIYDRGQGCPRNIMSLPADCHDFAS